MDGRILVIDLELKESSRDLDEENEISVRERAARCKRRVHHRFGPTASSNLHMDNKRPRRLHHTRFLVRPPGQRPAIMSLQSWQIIRRLPRCSCTDMANKDKSCP